MRRMKLLVACVLLILFAIPLLPGAGAMIIQNAIGILERDW